MGYIFKKYQDSIQKNLITIKYVSLSMQKYLVNWTTPKTVVWGNCFNRNDNCFQMFLFFFQTLLLHIPEKILNTWQKLVFDFMWYKKSRIQIKVFCKSVDQGEVAMPNLSYYYETVSLAQMCQCAK